MQTALAKRLVTIGSSGTLSGKEVFMPLKGQRKARPIGRPTRYTDREILAALDAAGGNKAEATRWLGCSKGLIDVALAHRAKLRQQVKEQTERLRREGRLLTGGQTAAQAARRRREAAGDDMPEPGSEAWERKLAKAAGLPPPDEAAILAILKRACAEHQYTPEANACFARAETLLDHLTPRTQRAVATAVIIEMGRVLGLKIKLGFTEPPSAE